MNNPQDFRELWLAMPKDERQQLTTSMGTSYRYLQRLSLGFAKPSLGFALRLQERLPGLDMAGFERAAQGAGQRQPR